jgi:colicin import membrane protein
MPKRCLDMFVIFALCLGVMLSPATEANGQSVRKGTDIAGVSLDTVTKPVTDWFERANREYQDTVVHNLSTPGPTADPRITGKLQPSLAPQTPTVVGPTVLDEVKRLLGMDVKPQPDAASDVAAKSRDEALARQREARAREQLITIQQERQIAEAKKAADLTADAATKTRQRAAEEARITADNRSKQAPELSAPTTAKSDSATKLSEKSAPTVPGSGQTIKLKTDKDELQAKDAKRRDDALKQAAQDASAKALAAQLQLETAQAADQAKVADAKAAAAQAADQAAADQRIALAAKKARDQAALADEQTRAQAANRETKLAEATQPNLGPKRTSIEPAPKPTPAEVKSATAQSKRKDGETDRITSKVTKDKRQQVTQASASSMNSRRKPKAESCSRAGFGIDLPAIYVVKKGDTLWDISKRYYDKGAKFEKIVRANIAKITEPDRIFPCQKIYLPARHAYIWVPIDDQDAS